MVRILFSCCLFLLVPVLGAQDPGSERLKLQASFEPAAARPGDQVKLVVAGQVADGFHVYGSLDTTSPLGMTIDEAGGLTAVAAAKIPGGVLHEAYGIENYWLVDKFSITQVFNVPAGAEGTIELAGHADFMACTETFCDPPATLHFKCQLKIAAAGTSDPAGTAVVAAPAVEQPAEGSAPPAGMFSQDPFGTGGGAKVSFDARFDPATARVGETVVLRTRVSVIPGWHVYGSLDAHPIAFQPSPTMGLVAAGGAIVPEGTAHEVVDDLVNYWVGGEFEVTQDFVVNGDARGEIDLEVRCDYMACDSSTCDPLASEVYHAKLAIEAGAARPEFITVSADAGGAAAGGDGKADRSGGLWALLLACVGGGIFALLMPCTYPMIPITFSFFTKQAEARGGNVLVLALVYGAGIVAMFASIGVVVGLVGQGADAAVIDLANNWILNTVLGVLFVLFAFVLFGLVNLQPPQFLMNLSMNASAGGGLTGVFLMGATLVITSFTCTAPIAGALLARAAIGRDVAEVVLGMAVFGLTMAVPFVILALAPGKVKAMPKSGGWMNTLKVVLGFVELAAAVKFFSVVDVSLDLHVLPRELFLLIWVAIFAMTTFYLLGHHGTGASKPGVSRLLSGGVFCAFAIYCLYGAIGFKLNGDVEGFIAPYSAETVLARGPREAPFQKVEDDYPQAVLLAKAEQKLVLLNFTGKN